MLALPLKCACVLADTLPLTRYYPPQHPLKCFMRRRLHTLTWLPTVMLGQHNLKASSLAAHTHVVASKVKPFTCLFVYCSGFIRCTPKSNGEETEDFTLNLSLEWFNGSSPLTESEDGIVVASHSNKVHPTTTYQASERCPIPIPDGTTPFANI